MYKNPYQNKSKFIVFEGLDASGKSLRAKLLTDKLRKNSFNVVLTKEPTKNSKEGREIIKKLKGQKKVLDYKEFQKDYTKDRFKHIKNQIIPSLKNGQIIISDRYCFSTFAYGVASGVKLDYLYELNQDVLAPDILVFVNTPVKVALKRISKQSNKELFEKNKYLSKVFKVYQKSIKEFEEQISIIKKIKGNLDNKAKISDQIEKLFNLVNKGLKK